MFLNKECPEIHCPHTVAIESFFHLSQIHLGISWQKYSIRIGTQVEHFQFALVSNDS